MYLSYDSILPPFAACIFSSAGWFLEFVLIGSNLDAFLGCFYFFFYKNFGIGMSESFFHTIPDHP